MPKKQNCRITKPKTQHRRIYKGYYENRIEVVGAAIVKDGRILALRRSDGIDQVKHKFEFAGGKVEKGENTLSGAYARMYGGAFA